MSGTLDHVTTHIGLRAPRVAIVLDGSSLDWDLFARHAIMSANDYWGGAGFVLVPHVEGVVAPAILTALRAYDPDYVVADELTVSEYETLAPGSLVLRGESGGLAEAEERARLVAENAQMTVQDRVTEDVRQMVSLACSPHRRRWPEGDKKVTAKPLGRALAWDAGHTTWDEGVQFLKVEDNNTNTHLRHFSSSALTLVDTFRGQTDSLCLHSPPGLGPLGLLVAARAGARRPLTDGPVRLTEQDQRRVVEWLTDPSTQPLALPHELVYQPGGVQLSVRANEQEPAWQRTLMGLAPFTAGTPLRRAGYVVVGDEPSDFALFLILDRLYGNATWIHSDWSPALRGPMGAGARRGLATFASAASRGRGFELRVTSVSSTREQLERFLSEGFEQPFELTFGAVATPPVPRAGDTDDSPANGTTVTASVTASVGKPTPPTDVAQSPTSQQPKRRVPAGPIVELPISYPTRGRVHLGVIEQFEQRLALPAIVDPDSPGEATLVSPLPALRPTDTILADNPYLTWQVTVSIETGDHAPMPGPRGLDGHALVPSDAESRETWVRPSRGGISYDSRKYDWVPANAIGEQRLARPRLRNLGLAAWVREMATQAGYETDISDAGMRGHLLASLWGSRRELAADVSGPFMNLVELFTRRGDSTLKAYPNGEGVLLHRTTGVLNYLGASSPWSSTSTADETRRLLDIHLQRGVLRRGLVLGCAICRDVAFVNVDDLGQRNRCQRCGALNDFTLQAWRQPLQDPDWYYELHPVVRDLVADNGHAPLWLAHHLASNAREYSDVTETILTIPGTRKAVAEADLIAVADGELITAEVKTNDELATGGSERVSAAEKRVLWAAVLRADQIVLATTQTAWKPSSIEALSRAIDTGDANRLWPPGARPALRLVTSIGTHSVSDTLVAPH